MNFLLHRHLALAELGLPAAGIGAMLPDLWRMADRRARARADVSLDGDEPVVDLLAGIAHHLEVDRWFHRSDVFIAGEVATRERLRQERFAATRVPLFAHVAWELCLDGALVRREGLDSLLADLRRDLAAIDGAALREAATRHATAEEGLAAKVDELLAAIAAGGWIAGYAHGAGLVERLGGIRRRIGLDPLPAADRRGLAAVLDNRLDAAVEALPRLLAAREKGPDSEPAPMPKSVLG